MSERVITYIDGFNLYFGLRDAGFRRYLWLDLVAMSRRLLKPHQTLVQARYFTARVKAVGTQVAKVRRQAAYLDALHTVPDLSIAYGHYLSKPMTCKQCGATWDRHEEKMTDVNIACALMEDSFNDRFDTALIISGDSDLTPPIASIRASAPGKRLIVVFPPKRHSVSLQNAAHGSFTLGRVILHKSQLPEAVTGPDGYVIRCIGPG